MMKQVFIPKIGAPEVLKIREVEEPHPKDGEVSIEVQASGINFADIMARVGLYPDAPPLPAVVGYEVSGTIKELGKGVSGFSTGQRVLAMTRFGGYSETICVPVSQVSAISDNLSFEKAAAIPVNYLTAWLMLVRLGNVQPGEKVLIHAAAGGVGQAALQICKVKGAEVIGTASESKHERLRQAGVIHCIDYQKVDFEKAVMDFTKGTGVQIVLDAVGGKSFRKSYRCLSPMGRLFLFGASSFAPGEKRSLWAALKGLLSMPTFRPIPLMNENKGVFGANLGHLWNKADELKKMLDEIGMLIREGKMDPVVDKVFPFSQAAQAHHYIQSRKNFGKVLLKPER
jgi:NADPH:quinone reductase-like Zn-dependent oxidoreductase